MKTVTTLSDWLNALGSFWSYFYTSDKMLNVHFTTISQKMYQISADMLKVILGVEDSDYYDTNIGVRWVSVSYNQPIMYGDGYKYGEGHLYGPDGKVYSDTDLKSITTIVDTPINPTITMVSGTDFEIKYNKIIFTSTKVNQLKTVNIGEGGDVWAWCIDSVSEEGSAIKYANPNLQATGIPFAAARYLSRLYNGQTTQTNLLRFLYEYVGAPYTKVEETVTQVISGTSISTDKSTYTIPTGATETVRVGEVLSPNTSLTDMVQVAGNGVPTSVHYLSDTGFLHGNMYYLLNQSQSITYDINNYPVLQSMTPAGVANSKLYTGELARVLDVATNNATVNMLKFLWENGMSTNHIIIHVKLPDGLSPDYLYLVKDMCPLGKILHLSIEKSLGTSTMQLSSTFPTNEVLGI